MGLYRRGRFWWITYTADGNSGLRVPTRRTGDSPSKSWTFATLKLPREISIY